MTKTDIVLLLIAATVMIFAITHPVEMQSVHSEHPVVSSQSDNEIDPAAVAGIVGQM
jgi:hypothetical protein